MPRPTDKALDELYLGDFEGFVERRNALVKRLRDAGDEEAAEQVRALKKPSRPAWAVNAFAAKGKKLRGELLKAGSQLADAQQGLVSGGGNREGMIKARDRERAAVAAALQAVAALAQDSGAKLSPAATEQVRHTLHAIALDPEVREQFEASRLTTHHEASGLGGTVAAAGGGKGEAPRGGGSAASRKKRDKAAENKRRAREELKAAEAEAAKRARELEAAERDLGEATKAAERAQGDLKRATRRQEEAQAASDQAAARLEALRER